MNVYLVCPAPAGSRKGNRVTAERWARLLRGLGHRVTVAGDWDGQACDVLIALHAKKSHAALRRYRERRPRGPLVVVLTGTDLYRDLARSGQARQSLELADRLVVLHDQAVLDVASHLRPKVRVVIQSAEPVTPPPAKPTGVVQFCVLGHLRYVKDPLRAALALRLLPEQQNFRVVQAGQALEERFARQATAAMARDSRYLWLGEVSRAQAQRVLAQSHALILSSRLEGGANVVSEAVVNGVPVLASEMQGNVGLLGWEYPAYYPVGDMRELAELMRRAGEDGAFYRTLRRHVRDLQSRFRPRQEQEAWRKLLKELTG